MPELEGPPKGCSAAEAAKHWKAVAEEKAEALEEMETELEESQQMSDMMEESLEEEKKRLSRSLNDASTSLEKAQTRVTGQSQEIIKLQGDIRDLQAAKKAIETDKVQIEMSAESSERQLRKLQATTDDYASKIENLTEEKVMANMERDDVAENEYRLRQELRDLQSELDRHKMLGEARPPPAHPIETQQAIAPPSGAAPRANGGMHVTPKTVDMVLQRVQQLQKHLASCRKSVQHIITVA